jgi:hypothetical protein|tara:strand:+ start:714 stop:1031 length:318 start_codon:yes stop_codon:yes gene_type:complete
MNKKAQLGFLTFAIAINVILAVIITAIYYDHVKARSCSTDSECGENSFCDENSRCQFQETIIKSTQGTVTIQKHNVKWGIFFIGISLVAAALILRPRKKTSPSIY